MDRDEQIDLLVKFFEFVEQGHQYDVRMGSIPLHRVRSMAQEFMIAMARQPTTEDLTDPHMGPTA